MVFAALSVFLVSVLLLLVRDVRQSVLLLGIEGIALSAMVWMSGPITAVKVVIGFATLLIKAGVIPGAMYRVVLEWPSQYRRDGSLQIWAYVVGVGMVLTVTHIIRLLAPTGIILHSTLFFYGLAAIFLGLLQIISRRHILSQVGSLVAVENAFVILAASVVGNLPMFMEFGMLVDLLVAAIILVWMSRLVHGQFNTTDVTAMRFLRR
ncbi:hypothetical protein [Alicyclobacillus mengziensis]|uniref:Hydrogenase-4 component E n=1 Tax=Alicyclobacillus mengziensis TaxID=2931921 RepID=A0A9X7VZS2_9BACL|nr:hypothetical protein [Alicyclobacillus mengziensis]QSO47800.1 hypothetical protein JZ786_01770 [Alicyclobacillus mengziensis]